MTTLNTEEHNFHLLHKVRYSNTCSVDNLSSFLSSRNTVNLCAEEKGRNGERWRRRSKFVILPRRKLMERCAAEAEIRPGMTGKERDGQMHPRRNPLQLLSLHVFAVPI